MTTTETSDEYDQLVARTEATIEKFREDAVELKSELGGARAATKVQLMAMIDRLEKKYDGGLVKLGEIKANRSMEELGELHHRIASELSDMRRTMERRIR